MLKENFVRLCLITMVLLLGIIACRVNSPETVDAAASDCLVEYFSMGRIQLDQKMTTHCKQRMAEGWRLAQSPAGGFVWVK
jgi:hypothetical protein